MLKRTIHESIYSARDYLTRVTGYTTVFIAIVAVVFLLHPSQSENGFPIIESIGTLYFSGLLAVLYHQQKRILAIENEPQIEVDGIRELEDEENHTLALLLSNIGNGVATNIGLEIETDILNDDYPQESHSQSVVRADLDDEEWFQEKSRSSYLNPDENRIIFLADLTLHLKYGGALRIPLIEEIDEVETDENRLQLVIRIHYDDLYGNNYEEEIINYIGPFNTEIGLNEFLRRGFPRESYMVHYNKADDYDPIDIAEGNLYRTQWKVRNRVAFY